MITFLLAALTAALLGSVHCAAMCGPLVGLYGGGAGKGAARGSSLAPHGAFAASRLLAYGTIGAVAGLVGQFVDATASSVASGQRAAAVLTGVALIVLGTVAFLSRLGVRLPLFRTVRGPSPTLVRLVRGKPRRRAAMVGLLTAALPCGWLYAFVLAAAGTGSPLWGALTMAMLWLGSSPLLFALGFGIGHAARRLGARAAFVTPVVWVVVGVLVILLRSRVALPVASAHAEGGRSAIPTEPSCHGP